MRPIPLALVLATLLATAPAMAQSPTPEAPALVTPGQPLANEAAEVDDAELQRFASAVGEIRQLRHKWTPQLEEAAKQGPEAAFKVQDEAYAEMVDAVETQGLSLRRYNQIAELAESDPELQDRIANHLQR